MLVGRAGIGHHAYANSGEVRAKHVGVMGGTVFPLSKRRRCGCVSSGDVFAPVGVVVIAVVMNVLRPCGPVGERVAEVIPARHVGTVVLGG